MLAQRVLAQTSPQYGYGPIEVTNQYLPDTLHSTWSPRSPRIVESGTSGYSASFRWTSTNALVSDKYLIDAENRELLLGYKYGVSDDFELGLEVPLLWRGSGVLDGFINSWHDFFGLPEGGRDHVADDRFVVSGVHHDGSTFGISDEGFSLGNIRTRVAYSLVDGGEKQPAVTVEGGVSLPVARDSFGANGPDFSLGLLVSRELIDDLFLYGGASVFYYTDTNISGLSYARFHNEDFLAFEWRVLSKLSAQISVLYSTETINNISGHDDYALYLDTGLSWEISHGTLVDATVRENPGAADSSADVSFVLGLRHNY